LQYSIKQLKNTTMKTTNNIKSLGLTLEELYKAEKQIVITLSDKPYQFDVVLVDRSGKADCKLSSWGANLWTRTNKGINYEKYTTLATLQSAITRLIGDKVDTNGIITFKLSDEVVYM
jgi:serine protease inhibitor ecotin